MDDSQLILKAFKYVKRMLPFFCAVVKLCSTNRLFMYGFSSGSILN